MSIEIDLFGYIFEVRLSRARINYGSAIFNWGPVSVWT